MGLYFHVISELYEFVLLNMFNRYKKNGDQASI